MLCGLGLLGWLSLFLELVEGLRVNHSELFAKGLLETQRLITILLKWILGYRPVQFLQRLLGRLQEVIPLHFLVQSQLLELLL